MFDQNAFDNMPKYDEFTYWFYRLSDNEFSYYLRDQRNESNCPIFIGILHTDCLASIPEDVLADFNKFQQRPEFEVGNSKKLESNISANNQMTMIDYFESTIVGAAFIRALNAKRIPDTTFDAVSRFLNWIRQTDFYSSPGSTKFHDAEPTGLLFHSLTVYNNILDLKKLQKFKDTEYHSIALISLCHDFTKIGNYEQFMRNVKNEQTNQWEQIPSYRWKCNPFPFGHGVTSMYLLSQFFKLSMEEMLAIRWHMGEYNVSERECGELEDASEQYPMVRMLQFADQLACVKY